MLPSLSRASLLGLVAFFAFAACSSVAVSPGGGSGTCPCVVGNTGLMFTIPCGGSECVALNGTVTGYRCESDGTHEDPAVCDTPSDAGGGGDASSGVDSSHIEGDSSVPPLPDGAVGSNECTSTASAGDCPAPDVCECSAGDTCSFACGAQASSVTVDCSSGASCGVSCAGDCDIDCVQAAACNVHVGGPGTVDCVQATDCVATVADGATVDCVQAGNCDVTCEGACDVVCTQATSCRVTCDGDVSMCDVECAGATPTLCPDGVTKVCGSGGC